MIFKLHFKYQFYLSTSKWIPNFSLADLFEILNHTSLYHLDVNSIEFTEELIRSLLAYPDTLPLGHIEIINIIESLVHYLGFDIHFNNDMILTQALINDLPQVATYLVERGLDPTLSIISHQKVFDRFYLRAPYEFIKYCMEKNLPIDWMYKLPRGHVCHIYFYVNTGDISDDQLKPIIQYLISHEYEPDPDLITGLISADYMESVKGIIDMDIELDINRLLGQSLQCSSRRVSGMLLKLGAKIDPVQVMKELINEDVEWTINVLLDTGCQPMEVLELLKRLL